MCVYVNNVQMQIKNAKQTIYEVMSGKLVKQVYMYMNCLTGLFAPHANL